jgi:hypothetical protein
MTVHNALHDGQPNAAALRQGYTMEEFLANHVDQADANKMVETTGDPTAAAGGNAYQSEPYFEYLQRS